MPPESHPKYLELIILTAVKFGKNHGCKLDGHLACKADKEGRHVGLTVHEVVSAVMKGDNWLAKTLREESSTLPAIEEVEEGRNDWEEHEMLNHSQNIIEMSDETQDSKEPKPPLDWVGEERYQLPMHLSERVITPSETSFTDHPSTFSGAPGPGYIMGKALYWTGSRVMAALEMFNINNRVRNHMDILRSNRSATSNSSPQYDMLFQILEDALELSKPQYAKFLNKYSIGLYNEYVKFLKRRPFPKEFFQKISSAMLTLSTITWISHKNYQQEFPFVKELIKICTERPVRLHDSDEISATQKVISPHLARIIPHNLYETYGRYRVLAHLLYPHLLSPLSRIGFPPSFISSFPWLAVAVYHEKGGENLAGNVLADIESFLVVKKDDWPVSSCMGWIEAYCSLICTRIKPHKSNYVLLDEIVRHTFLRLYAPAVPRLKRTRSWRLFRDNPVCIANMEVLLELLIWMRCELGSKRETEELRARLEKLSKLGLSNISPLAANYLSSCEYIPYIEATVEGGIP